MYCFLVPSHKAQDEFLERSFSTAPSAVELNRTFSTAATGVSGPKNDAEDLDLDDTVSSDEVERVNAMRH